MRVYHFGIIGDNVEEVYNGVVMNIGVIYDFLEFPVETLIINVAKDIE